MCLFKWAIVLLCNGLQERRRYVLVGAPSGDGVRYPLAGGKTVADCMPHHIPLHLNSPKDPNKLEALISWAHGSLDLVKRKLMLAQVRVEARSGSLVMPRRNQDG